MEVSTKTDVGFEATLWNSLLTVEADFFLEKRNGMLLAPAVTVPIEYGLPLAQENAGIMDNHGLELTLGSRHEFANGIRLGIIGNLSWAKNKMVQVFETPATYDNPNRRRTGRPYNTQFGYQSLGLFGTADDKNSDGVIDADDGYNVVQFGILHPGDIKYADISGPNGTPDGKIDGNDECVIGYLLIRKLHTDLHQMLNGKVSILACSSRIRKSIIENLWFPDCKFLKMTTATAIMNIITITGHRQIRMQHIRLLTLDQLQ